MSENYDRFEDYTGDLDGGTLEGSGRSAYDGLKQSIQPDGLAVQISCWQCGKPRGMVLEWPELFVIATNGPGKPVVLPPGYRKSEANGTIYYASPCPSCNSREGLAVHLTPDEAEKHVMAAKRQGMVSEGQLHAWGQEVSRARSRG